MRFYHPDTPLSIWDRLGDPLGTWKRHRRAPGVDYTLLNRAAAQGARELLEEMSGLCLLSDDMVRIDTRWRLPPARPGQEEVCAEIALRLRFGQVHPGGMRLTIPLRWVEFREQPDCTQVLLRLVGRPNPGLRSYVAGDLSEDGSGGWEEYALGAD